MPATTGFGSLLIAFERCSFSSLDMDSVTFQSNRGKGDKDSPVRGMAQLFYLDQSMFSNEDATMVISDLSLIYNLMTDTSLATF